MGTVKVHTELSSFFRERCLPSASPAAFWVPFLGHQILPLLFSNPLRQCEVTLACFVLALHLHNQALLNPSFPQLQILVPQASAVWTPPSVTPLAIPFKTRVFITVGISISTVLWPNPQPQLQPSTPLLQLVPSLDKSHLIINS